MLSPRLWSRIPATLTVLYGGDWAGSSLRDVSTNVRIWPEVRLVGRKTSTNVVALLLLLRPGSFSPISGDGGPRLSRVSSGGGFKLDITDSPRVALVGRQTRRKSGWKACKRRIKHFLHRQALMAALAGKNRSGTALGRPWL